MLFLQAPPYFSKPVGILINSKYLNVIIFIKSVYVTTKTMSTSVSIYLIKKASKLTKESRMYPCKKVFNSKQKKYCVNAFLNCYNIFFQEYYTYIYISLKETKNKWQKEFFLNCSLFFKLFIYHVWLSGSRPYWSVGWVGFKQIFNFLHCSYKCVKIFFKTRW